MTDTPVRLRGALDAVPAYVAGKPPVAREGLTVYKVSSNENPYPPLPSVLDVVRDAAATMNRYPDMGVSALTDALAAHLDVPRERIATGTGSVGVLGQIMQATCDAGDEVVYAWRSFEAYPIVVALSGATSVQVPLTAEHRHDLPAMLTAITERTKVVMVCTPNNPTGPSVGHDELVGFVDAVPTDVLVVVDEAYLEFVQDDDPVRALEILRDRPNVVVLRTFSKAYGLAGLRVGYAIADPEVITALGKVHVPFSVSSVAQAAALASLEAADELVARTDAVVAERARVTERLRAAGYRVPESQANFVWLDLGDAAMEFARAGVDAGVVIRPFDGDGVRVTVTNAVEGDVFLAFAENWGGPRA